MDPLIKALKENTNAIRANTQQLSVAAQPEDKEVSRQKRREELKDGVPYSREQLIALKRPDLVMLAAQLGVSKTSVPQAALVASVLEAQQ